MSVKASCCGNCKSGKPCCGTKPRPAFMKRRGLWLPRRDLTLPKNLLQYPSEQEWSGLWRPWLPAHAVAVDMSCLPCCSRSCEDCDPGANDVDPMSPDPLDVTISGAIAATDVLPVALDCGGAGSWSYENASIMLDAAGCGDGGWLTVSLCIYCDPVAGTVKANMSGGSASCFVASPNTREADSWTCSPFSATWTYETDEAFAGGCPCGDAQTITVTVTE